MSSCRSLSMVIVVAGLACGPALAQTATTAPQHVPLQKTIGQDAPEIVPSLIVMNSRAASLQDGKLTLTGVAPNSIVFADRPVRAAGHTLTASLLEEWSPTNESDESFAKDPPNATVSAFSKDGSVIRDAVVVLKTAKLEGDRLTFDVDVLEGELTGADGPASIFIDRFGFGGFHAVGFRGGFGGVDRGFAVGRVGYGRVGAVGVWRRPYIARGAWYRGAPVAAAAVGGAALGAAAVGAAAAGAYYHPYYAPYAPPCGYYPYPPCSFDGARSTRLGGPDEGFRGMIGLVDVAKDSCLQFGDGPEHPTPEALPCEFGKEALHGIEPGRRCRSEVEGPTRMPSEPFAHFRMLVGRIIVDNSVDRLSFGNLGLDGAEEADELLMSVARHATAGHLAFQDVESSEQGRGAMALVVMSHGTGSSLFHRQPRLGPIEGLYLALLVDREDNGMIRGIDIEANNILELGRKGGIVRQLELAHLMGLETVRSPDALDRTDADPDHLAHRRRGPVGRLASWGTCCEVDHAGDHRPIERRLAGGTCFVAQQPIHAGLHEALLPAPDHRFALARLPHDLRSTQTIRREQDDPGAPNMLLWAIPIGYDRCKSPAIGSLDVHHDSFAHPPNSHAREPSQIRKGTRSLDRYH